MDFKELSQLYYLNREIEADKKRLDEISSLQKNNQKNVCSDEIAELKEIISSKITRLLRTRNRIERYIAKIPDSITRQIFTLRFINGLSWVQIAFHIGGGNTADGVRKRLFRHLKNSKK